MGMQGCAMHVTQLFSIWSRRVVTDAAGHGTCCSHWYQRVNAHGSSMHCGCSTCDGFCIAMDHRVQVHSAACNYQRIKASNSDRILLELADACQHHP